MQFSTHRLAAAEGVPNNEDLPLLVYASAVDLDDADPAATLEALFERHGWTGCWRNGLFSFNHFHSTAHEVLGVYRGTLRAQFGGPGGIELDLGPGDVVVVPAGVAHKRIAMRGRLGLVGAYPRGQQPDLCEAGTGDARRHADSIEAVPLPPADPVLGTDGPLLECWRLNR